MNWDFMEARRDGGMKASRREVRVFRTARLMEWIVVEIVERREEVVDLC